MVPGNGGEQNAVPELPEVETTLRGISPYVVDETIIRVVIRNPKLRWPVPSELCKILENNKFTSARRRGKYLLLDTQTGSVLMHLGMSGTLRICLHDEDWKKHDHFALEFETGNHCRLNDPRRFGSVLWQPGDAMEHPLLANLGPEPLSDDFNANYLQQTCRNRKTSIKQHIMNGKIVTGAGNIYANEALFMSGIHPGRTASRISLPRLDSLVTNIKTVLLAAIEQGGTTLKDFTSADGKPGYFSQQLNVYGLDGEPCPRCQKTISKVVLGQRATYFCPGCQQ